MARSLRTNREIHLEEGLEVRERIRPWIEDELAPDLCLGPGGWDLSFPEAGEHSHVFLLAGARTRVVVRLFRARAGRVRTLRVQRHCRASGVRVPRVLAVYSSRRVLRRIGFSVLVEEFVAGRHPNEMEDRGRALLVTGRGLARLNDVTRPRWGNLRWGRRRGYFDELLGNVTKILGRLRRVAGGPVGEIEPRLLAWLEGYRRPISAISEFGLAHRAVIGSNLIVTEDDDLCIIDIQRVRYDAYPSTLVRALSTVCRDERERERMLDHYFAASKSGTREEFDRLSPPFEALWLLKLVQSGLNDRRLGRVGDVAPEWLARLEELLDVQPVG